MEGVPETKGNEMTAITSIGELSEVHAAQQPDKVALICDDRTWTYAELDHEANQVANALHAAGVGSQDRVAFLDKNAPEYFSFLIGAGKVNAVTVAVNWRLAPPEMEYILNNAEARVLLIGDEFLGHLAKMNLDKVDTVVVIGSSGEHPSYEQWIADAADVAPTVTSNVEDTCYQLYTSGTTGLPKGVELTNANFFA